MKSFKQFITEIQRYEMNPPIPDVEGNGRRTLYPYVGYPFPAQRTRPNHQNPMMTPPWITNPYWSPGGADEGDYRIPGIPWTDQYGPGTRYVDLPPWLRILWGIWYGRESMPGIDAYYDARDVWELFLQWIQTFEMTPEEYEDYVQQLLRWLRDHNFPVPEFIPTPMHQMFYVRLPNGTYQLMRWNPQTGQYEPLGEPIQNLPNGENVPPVYNHPDYVKPPYEFFPDFRPIHLDPGGSPYIPNVPWSPTRTPYQWSQGSEIPEDPMISGMGG